MLITLSPQPADEGKTPVVPTGVSLSDRTDTLGGGYPMPEPSSFEELPSGQRWQTYYQIARSLQQGQSERHLRRQPEAGTEENIRSLLDPDRVRNGKGDAARRIK